MTGPSGLTDFSETRDQQASASCPIQFGLDLFHGSIGSEGQPFDPSTSGARMAEVLSVNGSCVRIAQH